MKKMKKFLAMMLAMVMVLGMSVTALAAPESEKPTNGDTAEAKVTNVEAGATVTAYRIVEPTYNDNGFTGYKAAEGVTLADKLEPTSEEVTTIAADKDLLTTLTSASLQCAEGATGLTDFTAKLGAGYWVVVVTGSEMQEIYNPMLIGVYYTAADKDDLVIDGVVDANSNWSLNSTPAYAKSEQPTIDKKITGSTGKDTSDGNENGNDVAIGDTVSFEIETQIPSYSKSYTEVKVEITDKLSKGLALAEPANLVVKVNGTEDTNIVEAAANTYVYTPDADNKGFTISFASEYALAHSGEKIYVTYDAVVGEGVGYNFDANTNTATLEYTNDPHDVNNTNTIDDKTYTYTFAIDANLYGENNTTWNKFTEELLKTGEVRKVTLESGEVIETTTLPGATFRLTSTDREDKKVYEATSDENGYLSFYGLDAGKYELQETVAPEGYSLNDAVIPVEITAFYNDNGTLNSYVIKVNNKETSTYTATYAADGSGTVDNIKVEPEHENSWSDVSDTHEIKNTKLASLPSTGGIGTTIFTIGGCAIMIIAAGLFFASRRKKVK